MSPKCVELKPESNRNYSIDLIKVVAVIFVLLFHYADHGVVDLYSVPYSLNWCVLALLKSGGAIGNSLFILITGYLSYGRQKKNSNLLALYIEVLFYSITLGLIYMLYTGKILAGKDLIRMVFPVTFNLYWYFSSYIVLFLLMPYIDVMMDNINRKQTRKLLIIGVLLFSLLPTFTTTQWLTNINNLFIMGVMYLIGYYIKKYNPKVSMITCDIVLFLSVTFLLTTEIFLKLKTNLDPLYFAVNMNRTPLVVISLALFFILLNKTPPTVFVKFFVLISKHAFGIYLIHIGWIRKIIYKDIFSNGGGYFIQT